MNQFKSQHLPPINSTTCGEYLILKFEMLAHFYDDLQSRVGFYIVLPFNTGIKVHSETWKQSMIKSKKETKGKEKKRK